MAFGETENNARNHLTSESVKDRHVKSLDGEGLACIIHEASTASADTRL